VATEVDQVFKKFYGVLAFTGWGIEFKSHKVRCSSAEPWLDHTWNIVFSSGRLIIGKMWKL
ncbi:hypothetical protein, partial [Proteus mirabilis]|uniref:hypothetical protein n=1 Tax=Proteus mirabilis TaxID=584 RepID=UPI001C8AB2EF